MMSLFLPAPALVLPRFLGHCRRLAGALATYLQKGRDENLVAGEPPLRRVLDGMSEALAVIDGRGVIVLVNQPWRNFSLDNAGQPGLPRSDLGTNYLQVCASSSGGGSASSREALAGIQAVLDGKAASFELEYPCHSPDQARWFSMRATPLGDGSAGAVITHVDISRRKRVEDELHELRDQEEFFRLIAENLDGFVAVLDLEGRRVYNSPSYVRLLGDRDPNGSICFADVHPADRERVRQAFRDVVATGVGRHLEYRFQTADGGTRLLESHSGVIRDREGRVKRVVVVAHDITLRRQCEEEIHHLAFHDALTRLPNRLTLMDRLSQAKAANRRTACHGAVLFIDLDNFKPVNDTHGHEAGDLLLIEVAKRLAGCVRETDTVARFGGDEFVVMLRDLPADNAESTAQARFIAEKIGKTLAKPYRLTLEQAGQPGRSLEHRCTASIGVVLFIDQEAGPDTLLKWADAAMYQAKAAGRNLIHFHDPEACLVTAD